MRYWLYLATAAVGTSLATLSNVSIHAIGEESLGRVALPFPPQRPENELQFHSKNSLSESSAVDKNNFSSVNSLCGGSASWQDVELYNGNLGPNRQFIAGLQPHTGQLQWNFDLRKIFSGINDNPGNVEGERWCSGTLIADNLFLTAAHCFGVNGGGWQTPIKETLPGKVSSVAPSQLAKLMHVNFNYQIDGSTGRTRSPTSYKVLRIVELGSEFSGRKFDYAIIELENGPDGISPGGRFGIAKIDTSGSTLGAAETLTIIQHPNGAPKKIAAGPIVRVEGDNLLYSNLDTLGGSSGSGVYDSSGRIVAVHTNGGCDAIGANSGLALSPIAKSGASKFIK